MLVIEDDPGTRRLLELVLHAAGHDVLSATDGDEAIRVLGETHVDVIVLDLLLPRKSGIEFLRVRRQLAAWLQVPVIVISAMPELDALRTELRYLGAGAVLRKPFDVAVLTAAIDAHRRKRRSRTASQPSGFGAMGHTPALAPPQRHVT